MITVFAAGRAMARFLPVLITLMHRMNSHHCKITSIGQIILTRNRETRIIDTGSIAHE